MRFAVYAVIYAVGLLVQFSWMQYFSFEGVAPSVLLVMLIGMGLMRGPLAGEVMGFAWGLSWDALSVGLFGSHAFMFTIIGYLTGLLSHKWNENKVFTQMLLTGVASALFLCGMLALHGIFATGQAFGLNFSVMVQPFYNMLIAPPVFWVAARMAPYLASPGYDI